MKIIYSFIDLTHATFNISLFLKSEDHNITIYPEGEHVIQ